MKLVAYLRVSTDDKGQDPMRQQEVIQAWATQNSHSVLYWSVDEGTSGSISPLDRPRFNRAIREAKRLGCEGIVVETVDRFTRGGVDDQGYSRTVLMIQHGLKVVYADLPDGMEEWMEQVFQAILAAAAHAWIEAHKRKVNAGIKRAMAADWPNGRPGKAPKTPLSPEEWVVVDELIANNTGNRLIAVRISQMRGAHEVADAKARKNRMVSENWIRKQRLQREATYNRTSRPLRPKNARTQRNEPEASQEAS